MQLYTRPDRPTPPDRHAVERCGDVTRRDRLSKGKRRVKERENRHFRRELAANREQTKQLEPLASAEQTKQTSQKKRKKKDRKRAYGGLAEAGGTRVFAKARKTRLADDEA